MDTIRAIEGELYPYWEEKYLDLVLDFTWQTTKNMIGFYYKSKEKLWKML